jgi:hypothetical protein
VEVEQGRFERGERFGEAELAELGAGFEEHLTVGEWAGVAERAGLWAVLVRAWADFERVGHL